MRRFFWYTACMTDLIHKKCVVCEVGGKALTASEAHIFMEHVPQWMLATDAKQISRTFTFSDFAQALEFTNKVGQLAESEGHHPDIFLSWGKVTIQLWTHAVGGLSENDFILAAKIDKI